jgi:hypothetical protein
VIQKRLWKKGIAGYGKLYEVEPGVQDALKESKRVRVTN